MKVCSNMTALGIVANMNKANNKGSTAMQRLSSGLKINCSGDDPAGWAIANALDAQVKGLDQANKNSMDGISFIQTAEGALNEVHSMLNRMKELTVQGLNGSLSEDDKQKIQYELDELMKEIKNTQNNTRFNGMEMLNSNENTSIQIGSNAYEAMSISGESINLNQVIDVIDSFGLSKQYPDSQLEIEITKEDGSQVTLKGKGALEIDINSALSDEKVDLVTGESILEDLECLDRNLLTQIENGKVTGTAVITVKDVNGVAVTDANGNPIKYTGTITIEGQNANEAAISFDGKGSEDDLLTKIDKAIEITSSIRGRLGAYQNRLEYTVANLDVSEENMTSSLSRIQDADMAEEMTNYTLQNVITQSGMAMLAQANQRPQQILQLLNS